MMCRRGLMSVRFGRLDGRRWDTRRRLAPYRRASPHRPHRRSHRADDDAFVTTELADRHVAEMANGGELILEIITGSAATLLMPGDTSIYNGDDERPDTTAAARHAGGLLISACWC